MITALEYETTINGVTRSIMADKNMTQLNAWHLATIEGNGLPPIETLGNASFGLAGKSYNGIDVSSRTIGADLYADGYTAQGTQQLLTDAGRVLSCGDQSIGLLRLTNAAGERYRIQARCTEMAIAKSYRRSARVGFTFDCPYSFFEEDTLHRVPVYAVTGGKVYPLNRPYTFGNSATPASGNVTLAIENAGDVEAPCVFKLFGTGLSRVQITNQTTGAQVIVSGMNKTGIEISTDTNNLYARFADNTDAMQYVSMASRLVDFKLAAGANVINIQQTASAFSAAGTCIEYRGRYSSCL